MSSEKEELWQLLKETESRLNKLELNTNTPCRTKSINECGIIDQAQEDPIDQRDQTMAELRRQLGSIHVDTHASESIHQSKLNNPAIDVRVEDWEKRYSKLSIKCANLEKTVKLLNGNLKKETEKAEALARTLIMAKKTFDQNVGIWQKRVRDLTVKLDVLQGESNSDASQLSILSTEHEGTPKNYKAAGREIELSKKRPERGIEQSRRACDMREDGASTHEYHYVIDRTQFNPASGCQQVCKICQLSFNNEEALKDHETLHQKVSELQPSVHKSIANGISVKKRRGTSRNAFECELCPEWFITFKAFKKHTIQIHGFDQVHSCLLCRAYFSTRESLKLHKIEHRKPCNLCDETFRRCGALKKHIQNSHRDLFQFICEFCDKRFLQNDHLLLHKSSHTS